MHLEGAARAAQVGWWQGRLGRTGGRALAVREKRRGLGRAGWGCAVVDYGARDLGKPEVLEDDVYQAAVSGFCCREEARYVNM